jgi:hypothetical protein
VDGDAMADGPNPEPRRAGARPGVRPGAPGIGSIFILAFLVILVPGLAAYVLLRVAGLAIGPAGLLGLLVVFTGLGLYPWVLQRLGWVPPRRSRAGRAAGTGVGRPPSAADGTAARRPEGDRDGSR